VRGANSFVLLSKSAASSISVATIILLSFEAQTRFTREAPKHEMRPAHNPGRIFDFEMEEGAPYDVDQNN
jgi:hypothetical protein